MEGIQACDAADSSWPIGDGVGTVTTLWLWDNTVIVARKGGATRI